MPTATLRYSSVCDGIGAAHVAWQPLGWQCQWTSEIEPFPVAVVEHHYGFRNLGNMTKITEDMIHEPVDLLVGGTPCQSFSVAGLRGGLADPRGNLALRFVQLAAVMQPRWVVWENVPGVLSSGKGRDFGTFLGALGELGYGFAYRVLDAQWFGVAQRRRRVFVVGYLGDWRRAAAVLFERESVFGNPPTRGEEREESAAGFAYGTTGGIAKPLGSHSLSKGRGTDLDNTTYVAFAQNQREEVRELGDCATALNLQGTHQQTFLATPYTKSKRAQSVTDDESWVPGEVSPTMSCFDQGDTRATTVVAFKPGQSEAAGGTFVTEEFCPTIQSQNNGSTAVPAVAFSHSAAAHSYGVAHVVEGSPPLRGGGAGNSMPAVATAMAVRRLTPRECERLQGFPDDYTLVTYRGKPACDGPRYRALGNSMAVPVMRWIGDRISILETVL